MRRLAIANAFFVFVLCRNLSLPLIFTVARQIVTAFFFGGVGFGKFRIVLWFLVLGGIVGIMHIRFITVLKIFHVLSAFAVNVAKFCVNRPRDV